MKLKQTQRQAVRAVMLTPEGQMLMLRLRSPRWVFWIAPGGGIDEGEDDHSALERELFEETGLRNPRLGPLIWTRESSYVMHPDTEHAVEVFQSERFYLVTLARFEAHPHNMPMETERDWFQGFGWVTPEDIEASTERFLPTQLATHLRSLNNHGAPARPVDVGR